MFNKTYCLGLKCVPQEDVEVLTPVPVNVNLFGNTALAEDKVEIITADPHPLWLSLWSGEKLDTDIRRVLCEYEDRYLGDASIS